MKDRELISIIRAHREDSLGANDGALSNERAAAMDRYHGRPYGNEEEGRSAVVSRDLSETVDWAMPAIMRVFTQSGNVVEFDPVGPEDEELAQQESDAVNQVLMKDNGGFLVIYDACKDAMLLKNGYIKHSSVEEEKVTEEEYEGLTVEELQQLMGDLQADGAEVKIKGQEEHSLVIQTPQGPQPIQTYDIRLQIKRKKGRVDICAVPAEEVRVSRKCRGSLQTSVFTEHVTRKTRSDLIELGMPRSFVDTLPAYSEMEKTEERMARDSVHETNDADAHASNDRSMDEIEFCEAYLRVDWDGDGVAELRKVVTVADKIPPGEEWNEQIDAVPITGGVIKRIPHRHVGESLDDEIADLAEIKTTLFRQLLDNIYLTNNSQWLVNERVNLGDFLQSLPGGVKRIKGMDPIGDAASPLITTPIINQVLPALDYIDNIKQGRSGISDSSTGLDPDILKQSTKGAFLENLNRASQKIEMIARLLGETLIKEAALQVHSLMIKHQDKPRMMKLRGKYVSVNPQEWRERTDLTLRVGLGTGNNEEKQQKLMMAAQIQEKTAALGLVGPDEGYNLACDIYKALGFDMPEKYCIDPNPQNPKWQEKQKQMGSQKDPLVQAEEVKGQAALQKAQLDQQGAAQQAQIDAGLERERMAMEMQMKERDAERSAELERFKAELKAQTDKEIAVINAQIELEKEQLRSQYTVAAASAGKPATYMKPDPKDAEDDAQEKARLSGMVQQIGELVSMMREEMNAPTEIVRGPDGRAAGVKKGNMMRNIVRGPDGRATGVQ